MRDPAAYAFVGNGEYNAALNPQTQLKALVAQW